MNVHVTKDFYDLFIQIDGSLHVHIPMAKYLAMQSWTDNDHSYTIEFILTGNSLRVEYTTQALWLAVLAQLEQVL